jgi:hydroxymethylglutaryl-CoA reductase
MNGIDAVVLATGNDFRAVEAGFMPTPQNQVNTLVYHMQQSKEFLNFGLKFH